MSWLLAPIGAAMVLASAAHGYLGQTRLIDRATFTEKWAKGLISAIWHYSTLTWALVGAFVLASPWIISEQSRAWAVPLACLPLVYGVIFNFIVTRGRHFGWMIFASLIVAASLVASL